MARYLIHLCNEREWYVKDYLIPSMMLQGIDGDDIWLWQDLACEGNLKATINAFKYISNEPGGTWHLQDDIVISQHFKQQTEEYDSGIKCGFANTYVQDKPPGYVPVNDMWYSFPCIRIPNSFAWHFVQWFEANKHKYPEWLEENRHDDEFFKEYMIKQHPTMRIVNISPNLVENVDYLIGGSIINKQRGTQNINSIYWNEPQVVENLRTWLRGRK